MSRPDDWKGLIRWVSVRLSRLNDSNFPSSPAGPKFKTWVARDRHTGGFNKLERLERRGRCRSPIVMDGKS